MPKIIIYALTSTLLLFVLQGCALVVVGAAGGAMVIHDKRPADVILDDTRIETRATDILYGDAKLQKQIHINVTSYNHAVLLTGEVLSAEAEQQALEIVRNIEKVKLVHNELRVSNLTTFSARSGDTWLTSKVKTKMLTSENFDANRIKVVTEDDSVYLMGIVTREMGKRAAEIASQVKGVKRVVTFFEYEDVEEPQTRSI